jgi:cytochrome c oxidase subunit 2
MTSRVKPSRALHAALLGLIVAGCGGVKEFPQTAMDPKSDYAKTVDSLQWLTIYLGVAVGIVVFTILGYIVIRFRHKPGDPVPTQVHGNTTLELAWTLIPAVLIAIIAVPTVRTIFATQAEAPPNALTIDVRGYQWWWQFRYPLANGDTVVTANEIHVPVGQPIHLRITSQDVLHSFWIPQMGGKRDLVPNRINHINFTPLEEGVYLGQCAEFCGSSHALMKMRLIAHKPADFQKWLAHERSPAVESADSAILHGKQLVTAGACAGCHTIQGTTAQFGKTAPNLTHLASRATIAAGVLDNNAANLAKWIANPQSVKPGAIMPPGLVPEQELKYVVAYLQTLY